MKIIAPVTAITAIVLVPLLFRLAFAVIGKRREHQVALGTGNQPELEVAIRTHGNFVEYVPFVLMLLLCAEVNSAPLWLTIPAGLALITGRWLHASAIPAGDIGKRVKAMQLTFASIAFGAMANLAAFVVAFFA